VRRLPFQLTAAALAALSLLTPAAAKATSLLDATPGTTDLTAATVVESKLPTWLQVVVASAPLYAQDTGTGQAQTQLARYTFLRVLNGGISRIQVQAYDDNGNPGPTGWLSADQVLPSAPGINWLVTSTPTVLTDVNGNVTRNLDRFVALQQIDGSSGADGRITVRVYRSDFSGVVDQGWVDATATGPALPPQLRVPSPDRTTSSRMSTVAQGDFLDMAGAAARQASARTGVPASVTVAQAILESDWGRSALAQNANNYFGMKAMGTLGDDGVVWMPTSEYDASGQLYQTTSAFRAYKSLADSVADHDLLLENSARYASAMRVANDPKQFAQQLAVDGYATDPSYADKLIALMDRYGLYSLDS
jgi:Mannosyl-glycoprotein endo-beta-N-acetylglucosaminidase